MILFKKRKFLKLLKKTDYPLWERITKERRYYQINFKGFRFKVLGFFLIKCYSKMAYILFKERGEDVPTEWEYEWDKKICHLCKSADKEIFECKQALYDDFSDYYESIVRVFVFYTPDDSIQIITNKKITQVLNVFSFKQIACFARRHSSFQNDSRWDGVLNSCSLPVPK